jgi:DNA polymerase-3 subunit epsilon
MRQIVLDTETTGLEVEAGHRVIEIGAVELIDRRVSGNHFQVYLDPERDIEDGALEVHGITREFLSDKPRFREVVEELIEFIAGAELVIHNADFDLAFLDMEFGALDPPSQALSGRCQVIDTLALARDLHPGQRNSLDALCRRCEIDNSQRKLHGALLDAEILADVYLAMTGGQTDLGLSFESPANGERPEFDLDGVPQKPLVVLRATETEQAAHESRLQSIRENAGHCLWLELELEDGGPV